MKRVKSTLSLVGLVLVFFVCGAEVQAATPAFVESTVPAYHSNAVFAIAAMLAGQIEILKQTAGAAATFFRVLLAGTGITYALLCIVTLLLLGLATPHQWATFAIAAYAGGVCLGQLRLALRTPETEGTRTS